MLYGAGLFALQDEGLNSVTGLGAKPQDYPWQAHARGLVAHLVYGIVTELALSAIEKGLGRGVPANRAPEAAPTLALAAPPRLPADSVLAYRGVLVE